MNGSLFILLSFACGIIIRLVWQGSMHLDLLFSILLITLLLLSGITMGMHPFKSTRPRSRHGIYLLLPVSTLVGSMAGTCIAAVLFSLQMKDGLILGSGLGYYSLSAFMIREAGLPHLALLSLFTHMAREILALAFIPLLTRTIGPFASISAAAATSIDTALPTILQSARSSAPLAIVHGGLLTILVPVLLEMLLSTVHE